MGKDKWGYLVCLKGCSNRTLNHDEDRVDGKVKKIKEAKLTQFF